MSKKLALLLLTFILGSTWNRLAVAETFATKTGRVAGIELRGRVLAPEKELYNVIFTRVGDPLTEEKIQGDLKALYALGYFSDVSSTFEVVNGGTKVVFLLKENPRINSLVIEGNTVFPEELLLATLESKPGELLNFKKVQADITKINELYKNAGYLLARVIDVETDQKNGQLTFKIMEGVVEAIVLSGNETTKDYVILREFDTKPGSILNEETLKKDLRRLFNLGFFSEITPNFEAGSSKDKVVLQLNIKESRSSTINFGGGYGEREGWFGFADLTLNNLLGTAQGVMIRGQTGQELSTYQLKYNNPWMLPEKLGPRRSFTFRRWLTIGRDIFLGDQSGVYNGGDVSLGHPFRDNFNIIWTLGSEYVSPYSSSTFEAYQSNTLGITFAYDTRDFWLNPKEGKYYTLDIKNGWKQAGSGDTNFFKINLDLNHYQTIIENQVFAWHVGVGLGLGDVPIGDLYWAGGANSIRGYYPSETQKGKRKFISNFEYRLNFSDMFQAVFFYDWGGAWNSGPPILRSFISGWGPGIRVNTPLGPIRLDYGVPGDKTFGEGIMHFSIGHAF